MFTKIEILGIRLHSSKTQPIGGWGTEILEHMTVLEVTLGVAAEGRQVLLAKDGLECCCLPGNLRGLGVMEEDVHSVLRNPQVCRHDREDLSSMGFVLLFAKFSCSLLHEK